MAVRKRKDGRWIVYYRDPEGKKGIVNEYFGHGPEGKIKAIQRDSELGLKTRRPSKTGPKGPTFFDLSVLYMKYRGFKPRPLEQLKIRLTAIILPRIGHKRAILLSDDDMDEYVATRRRSVKDNSIARELTDIKAILNWSVKRRPPLIPFNPVRDYQGPSKKDEIILPPSQDEINLIYKNSPAHLQRFIMLSSFIGARPGRVEILSLRWRSVSWDSATILIISAEKGGPESRQVPIHKDFLDTLKKWFAADKKKYGETMAAAIPIAHYYGRPVASIKKAWSSALVKAKITRRIRPYDLRHRFVTKALQDGADIGTLAEMVGSRPETLRKHYQHVTSAMHRNTMDQISGLGMDDDA